MQLMRELRARRQANGTDALSVLENIGLMFLLMSSIVAVPLVVAALSLFIR